MDVTENPDEAAPTAEELVRSERSFRRLDIAIALFFFLMGVVVLQQVYTELPLIRMRQVGPGMLPFGVGCILFVMGLAVLVQSLRGRTAFSGEIMPTLREGSRVAFTIAMLIATIVLMPVLGTLVTLCLFIIAELRFVEGRSWLLSTATAVLVPLFIYATFEATLGVQLPAGILGLR